MRIAEIRVDAAEGGRIELLDRPGLGLVLDDAAFERLETDAPNR